jgi:predicted helicase
LELILLKLKEQEERDQKAKEEFQEQLRKEREDNQQTKQELYKIMASIDSMETHKPNQNRQRQAPAAPIQSRRQAALQEVINASEDAKRKYEGIIEQHQREITPPLRRDEPISSTLSKSSKTYDGPQEKLVQDRPKPEELGRQTELEKRRPIIEHERVRSEL